MTNVSFNIFALTILLTFSCGKERLELPEDHVPTNEAINYIDKIKTVCGKVVESRYDSFTLGHTTYFYLDRTYPDQIFAIIISGNDRNNFSPNPEDYYLYKSICVTGSIQSHEGIAQIEMSDPKQIRITRN